MSGPLLLLMVGVISGIISSLPIGPTNLWIANALLPPKKPRLNLFCFVSAITLMDTLYALIAFWGYYSYLRETAFGVGLGFAVALGLMALGFYEIYDSKRQAKSEQGTVSPNSPSKIVGDFFLGILLGANPTFILYWLAVAHACNDFGIDHLDTGLALVICLGVVFGDALWYGGLITLLERGLQLISSTFIIRLRGMIGFGFVAFALVLIYKML
ncbi:MAG: hypothetical protein ABGX83_05960 [Nitrospira sp.]|nr:hypothetical protein [Candidatus Manganitrophaceae bacterium]HIL33988.1 hypothetical protein [Candidatus Manganitrophaceae bacterium]